MIRKLYPGGKEKAFNITYDDGVEQDARFVALLNKYALKGTFNLNSGLMAQQFTWTHENGMPVTRLAPQGLRELYLEHEVASHTLTHPYMQDLSDEELLRQLGEDRENLEALFGREVKGFAVPFDYYDDRIAESAQRCGFEYARMSEFSLTYEPCTDWYHWKTGVYHIMPELVPFVEGFLATDIELAVCQIVGHSYDLDALDLWNTMEDICGKIAARPDVWSTTNLELVRYLKAMEKCLITGQEIQNHSSRELWFEMDGRIIVLAPGEFFTL